MRLSTSGSARFLTFSCEGHKSLLEPLWARDLLADQLALTKDRLGFSLYAWCVMPDHVHLLLRPRDDVADVGRILRSLKTRSSKLVLGRYEEESEKTSSVLHALESRRLWQHGGGHDRSIHSAYEFQQKLADVVMNPVKAGLSLAPAEFPGCSIGSVMLPGDPWWE